MSRLARFRLGAGMAGLLVAACGAQGKTAVHEFDGARAFTYLERQVSFGPRIPGTAAHDSTGDWILARLRERADTVIVQDIPHRTAGGQTLHLRNFLARFRSSEAERVLYLAHWDTRPRADQSANLAAQRQPVLGANDGASGVAVLLGVADALKAKPPAVGVDLLFVDGEDYGDFSDSSAVLIGSRWFAAHQPAGYPPLFAVLFDMVGDRDLHLPYEQNSQGFAPEVVDRVWSVADSLGYGSVFVRQPGPSLIDDHVALQHAGIHAIDVVDFDYGPHNGYWHTTDDTQDKVSAQSLQIVGDVAVALVRTAGR
jgi:glutaminyl-peptide cyclotransferase